jgi:hypothetical protein
MKNLLISGLVIGSLICPIALANTPEQAAAPAVEAAQPEKQVVKKKKHHAKKKHSKHHRKHAKGQMSSAETPAEKKIDEETDLTNR